MIVAFEGIDGAGKTTTVPLVVEKLAERGLESFATTKRHPVITAPFALEQAEALADRLWGIPHDARLDTVGTLHWIYLNAAYFAAVHHALSAELDHHQVAVMDNWINKFVARIACDGRYPLAEIRSLLRPLPQPDMVFLLDVDPAVAARRKKGATDAERGLLAGADDFAAHQGTVRKVLLALAEDLRWVVVSPGPRSAAEIAQEVADTVHSRLLGHS